MNDSRRHSVYQSWHQAGAPIFVLVVIALAIWQLITYQYTLKWDAIDITLPWRYFTTDAFRHGFLPLWNPFQHQGFAQGAIPETWYPIGIILGIFKGYSLYSLNLEYFLHLLIASAGFYRLARTLHIDRPSALLGSLIFPLSGFFVGNAQHMGWIIAGAWIPHIFHAYLQFRRSWKWHYAIYFVIGCFMLASGGYTAYCIVTAYMLAVAFIIDLVVRLRSKKTVSKYIAQHARLILLTFTTCAVILVGLVMLKNDIYRGFGLTGEASLKGSLRLKHLLSLLFPFPTVKDTGNFWQGDQSLINMYIGLIGLVLAGYSLRSLHQSFVRNAWVILLVFLALALGHELPVRSWFNALPLFDLFRLPSLFRYYIVLILIILAAKMLTDHRDQMRGYLQKIALSGAVLFALASTIYAIQNKAGITEIFKGQIHTLSTAFGAQFVVHTFLLSLLYILLKVKAVKMPLPVLLLIFSGLDMFIAVQLNGRVSIFSEDKIDAVAPCLENLPRGYPLPILDDLIGSNTDQNLASGYIYRNTSTLYKRIGWNGYTPFQYKKYIELEQSAFFTKNLNLPPVYLSPYRHRPEHALYFTSEPDLHFTKKEISVVDFSPNHVELLTSAQAPRLLVYNQNLVDGWKGYVDGKFIKPVYVDIGLVGFLLPKGQHTMKIIFKPGYLLNGLLISVSLISFLLLIYWIGFIHQNPSFKRLSSLLLIPLAFMFYEPVATQGDPPSSDQFSLTNQVDQLDSNSTHRGAMFGQFLDESDMPRFKQTVLNLSLPFVYRYRPLCPEQYESFERYLRKHFVTRDTLFENDWHGLICLTTTEEKKDILFLSSNQFEGPAQGWKNNAYHNKLEANGNRFQDLTNAEYSATFERVLDTSTFLQEIIINIDVQAIEASDASLICSITHHDNSILWKSWQLVDDIQPVWDTKRWQIEIKTQLPAGSKVGIYVWNPTKASIGIDNIEVQAKRH